MPGFRTICSPMAPAGGRSVWLTTVLFMFACVVLRAEEPPLQSFQFGGGGSYGRSNRLPDKNGFWGFLFGGSWAQNRWLRWTGDVGFEFAGSPIQEVPPEGIPASTMASLDQMLVQLHAGPEFTRPAEHVTLFAHVLPGYMEWSLGSMGAENRQFAVSEGGFSMAAGGGMDLHVRSHFDVRLQADYMPAWHHQGTTDVALSPPLPPGKSPYGNFRVAVAFLVTGIRHPR